MSAFVYFSKENNIMLVMQKWKFMQGFTFAFSAECLRILAKSFVRNCTQIRLDYTYFIVYKQRD